VYTIYLDFKAACLQIHVNFHENFENVFKCKYGETTKKVIYTLQRALTIHVNFQKEVKIYINTSYCVSNAVEL
jgi:hypothetical protein